MFKIICVTNRKLCGDFLTRIEALYKCGAEIILREKDLSEAEYEELAKQVIRVCPDVTLHTYAETAKRLGANKIHLPFSMIEKGTGFLTSGVSVHSAEEARQAEQMGADYVTAGHIFATDCKKGLAPRGIEFLAKTARTVNIPVYAIGGITPGNIALIKEAGAQGACIMSGFMRCDNAGEYMGKLRKAIGH